MIKRTRIDHRLCRFVSTEHYKQITNHCSLLLFIKFNNLLSRKLIKSHLNHRNSTVDNFFTCSNDCGSLLTSQHNSGNFRCVSKIVDTCFHNFKSCHLKTLVEFLSEHLIDFSATIS